jgi:glycosyltransferase involved in cell wall biosynthesis
MAIVTTIADAQWQFMRGQNRFLADAGFELHGIASPNERLRQLADRDGIEVHAVAMSREIRPLADVVALVRMVRTLRRIRPDVLHVSTPKAALVGSIAGWLTGVPVRVFLVRGLITDGARGLRKHLLRAAEALTVRLCHASYFTSRSLLQFAEEERIISPGGGHILRNGMSNGVDLIRFNPERVRPINLTPTIPISGSVERVQGPVIGYVGRLGRDKGLDLLWRAWQRLRIEFPQARLLIVGGWEQERPVDAGTRRSLEDDPRVIIAGRVEDQSHDGLRVPFPARGFSERADGGRRNGVADRRHRRRRVARRGCRRHDRQAHAAGRLRCIRGRDRRLPA